MKSDQNFQEQYFWFHFNRLLITFCNEIGDYNLVVGNVALPVIKNILASSPAKKFENSCLGGSQTS